MTACIIHIGMHKTGTSAIQSALSQLDDNRFRYARIGNSPNHSVPVYAIFNAAAGALKVTERYLAQHGFALDGYLQDAMEALDSELARAKGRTLVISGEDIARLTAEGALAMRKYFERSCDDINVVAYIRSPASYMTSAFQEMVRNGNVTRLDPARLYRSYRGSFAKFDEVFGRERVTLRKYDRSRLKGGDAVEDFVNVLGAPMPALQSTVTNESSPREVICTLFRYNRFCEAKGLTRAGGGHVQRLLGELEFAGGTRFRFSPDLLRPILASQADDIAWMEGRLGESLAEDLPAPAATDIRHEDDLLAERMALKPAVLAALRQRDISSDIAATRTFMEQLHYLLSGLWPDEAAALATAAGQERRPGKNNPRKNRDGLRSARTKRTASTGDGVRPQPFANRGNVPEQIPDGNSEAPWPELGNNPKPLLNIDKNLAVLWAPKSACTSVYLWFSFVSGFMTDVRDYGKFPHRHRIEQYLPSDLYRRSASLMDINTSKVVKIIRDPYVRAASIYRHALKTRLVDELDGDGRSPDPLSVSGLSFQTFLDILGSHSPNKLNVHLRPQYHALERRRRPDHVINISSHDLFAELNKVAHELGLAATSEQDLAWVHTLEDRRRAKHSKLGGHNLDEALFTQTEARRSEHFPSYGQLLTETAREKIRRIFAVDFENYAEALAALPAVD